MIFRNKQGWYTYQMSPAAAASIKTTKSRNFHKSKLELWVTSLSDTPRLQYYDVQTLEYRYISKLPMKKERIWSNVKETTSHLQN